MKKVLPESAKINKNGHLEIGGVDTLKLAQRFGTPLYVLDEYSIRSACRSYKKTFSKYKNFQAIFASKALSVKAVLKIIKEESMGADISTSGELFTALKAALDPKKIYFHGNNKLKDEVLYALKAGIKCFVVDNLDELSMLDKLTNRLGVKANIMFRVNPGIEAHTHDFIKTGAVDSKFGISRSELKKAISIALSCRRLNFLGLHSHIGSQIFDIKPFVAEVEVLFKLMAEIKKDFGVECKELNIGGGVGIAYCEKDVPPQLKKYASMIIATVKKLSKKYSLREPKLLIEPGRSLVGRAGVTLYTVGTVKEIPGVRTYAVIDGGMTDNPRYILYQARYEAFLAGKMNAKNIRSYTIAGRACESGDIIIKDIKLPSLKRGDIIAVASTGAYNYSMASNYNRMPRPAMVLVNKGNARLIVRRETKEDIIRNDL
ncbi:MAG: diaminopimelate decarboxylase [Candidatus Margulisiibacteriota bacterium]